MTQTTSARTALNASFRGAQIRPGDTAYDSARAMYNGSIDRRPVLILRPTGAADVVDAVNYAREEHLPLAVRCGGHSVAGTSIVDGGLLLDLSSLKGVHVDPDRRVARAEAGALWGEYDRETQLFGLATPGGRVTTTGVGGFTLGGGYGWTSTKFGLTCDNLVGAEHVGQRQRVRGRRHVVGGRVADGGDRVEDHRQLRGQVVKLRVGEVDPRQVGEVRDLLTRDVGHGTARSQDRCSVGSHHPKGPRRTSPKASLTDYATAACSGRGPGVTGTPARGSAAR